LMSLSSQIIPVDPVSVMFTLLIWARNMQHTSHIQIHTWPPAHVITDAIERTGKTFHLTSSDVIIFLQRSLMSCVFFLLSAPHCFLSPRSEKKRSEMNLSLFATFAY